MIRRHLCMAVTLGLSFLRPPAAAAEPGEPNRAALAVEWNRRILEIAVEEDRLLTLKGVRTAALLHTSMHDALNAVDPRFDTFLPQQRVPEADGTAAANEAAYGIAIDQYPDHARDWGALRDHWIARIPEGEARDRGIALGEAVARKLLAAREDDGWNGEAEYTWHPMAPGVYAEFNEHSGTPEGFVFGAGWAAAEPFLLERPDHFRSPPPPGITSEAYARAFREVKEMGAAGSRTRTADQTHLAMWWKDFVENSHNRLARDLVLREDLDLMVASRMFALLNMTIFDAYVCVFDNKFHYNHWRPYTAIRWAEHDGNPGTEPDPEWTNLHDHTYAFPSYPSAHGCASAAAMTVLANTLGDGTAFTMRTPEVDRAGPLSGKVAMDPPTRSFSSFSEAAWECSLSRVYLGIHFRYDSEEGYELGSRIGRYAVEGFLRPVTQARSR